jgi:hypothetical protein
VSGISTGQTVSLERNGAPFASQLINDVSLTFARSPTSSSSPGNLTDSLHVVLQGSFGGGTQNDLLVYNSATQDWWVGVSTGDAFLWTRVQTTTALGNLNDGSHTWWVGDFEGSGRQQVLVYGSVDGNWFLGSLGGEAQGWVFGSMTWTTLANTSALGLGNLNTSSRVYAAAAPFEGAGSEQLYVFDAKEKEQYLGVIDATGTTMTITSLGTLGMDSLRDGAHVVWTGQFSGGSQAQILSYDVDSANWFLGGIASNGSGATWTSLGTHAVGNLLTPSMSTSAGDFTGAHETELMIFDGNSTWTLARMNAGELTIAAAADWTCSLCTVYAGDFSGSGRTELVVANRWGRVGSPDSPTLEWTDLAAGVTPSSPGAFARVGHYATTTQSELLFYSPTTSAAQADDWTRYALDAASPTLTQDTEANTRGLPPFFGDPARLLFAGAFSDTHLDDLVAYDSVTDSYWLGRFGEAAVALPSLLSPGDSITASSGGAISAPVAVANNVSTEHYDNARSGSNPVESTLTPSTVLAAGSTLSVKATYIVSNIDPSTGLESAQVDAQPLFVHDVQFDPPLDAVYVATEADWVYAFAADAIGTPAPLASRQLVLPGEEPLPWADQSVWCKNIYPTVGIGGTPVIDVATQTLYVVARTRDASGSHHVRLHALDLVTLEDRQASPVELESPAGVSQENFALLENQRAALLLDQGSVWVTFAGHCDTPPYAGYAFTFDAGTLDAQSVLQTVSDPSSTVSGAGIWQGSVGPASAFLGAGSSRVFMSTGNLVGAGDGGQYISDAVMAVSYPFASIDGSWSPVNESTLSAMDWDLASSGVVVLPNNAVLVGGKQGYLYVIDQTTMQCVPPDYLAPPGCATLNPPYSSLDPCGLPLSVDSDGCPILSQPTKSYPFPGVVGAPAVYTSGSGATTIFIKGGDSPQASGGWLQEFAYAPATRQLSRRATAKTDYPDAASIAVAANSAGATGLVWFVDHASAGLRVVVYDAANLSSPESTFPFGPAPIGANASSGRGFVEPTIMDGRVYIGYSGGVSVLGL